MATQTDPATVIKTPDQRLRVFVSSTLEELSDERVALRGAIEDLHLTPVMFELGASPHPPRALYRAYLEQSHVFVGIYWQRYGWVAPDMEVSGLEDEYLLSDGRPRLVYFKEPADEREERMGEFVSRIKSDGHSFRKFRTTDELAELLREDLAHLLTERFESVTRTEGHTSVPSRHAETAESLPIPATRLVGREQSVSALLEMLSREDVRLLTLTGVGGIGKSRLVLEVAHKIQANDQRVFFVDLTTVTDPDALPKAVAAAVGVPGEGSRPLIEGISERLRQEGPALLVLDNFEQIVDAAHYVADLLAGCPELKAVVASRILLDIRGEHHWEVEPLHTLGKGCSVEQLASCSAIQLFVDRAQAADPQFTLDEANAEQLTELCERLEGLPLAIELTAAYVRLLPPQSLLDRFDTRLDLEAHADHPHRQRTLRATIDWSYGLLNDAERQLFARLAVFSGGWDLKAAQVVCGPECAADVLQTLSNLVDKSLVTIDNRGIEPRFRMLETVREYAAERLSEGGELRRMHLLHAEYFASVCAEVGAHLDQHESWFPRLDPDRENLLAMSARAQADADLVDPLVRAWSSIWVYSWSRGLVAHVAEVMLSVQEVAESLPAETRTGHAFLIAAPLFLTGRTAEAQPWIDKLLTLAKETGNEQWLGLGLVLFGSSQPYETHREEANAALTEAVAIFRKPGHATGLDMALAQLGVLRLRDGQIDEAIEMHRECLEIGRAHKADAITAFSLGQLALDHMVKGEVETAREYLLESADCCRRLEQVGNREATTYCLEGFASIALAQGHAELAAQLIGGAQAIRDLISTPVWALLVPFKEALLEDLRDQLGDESFEVEAAAGADIGWEVLLDLGIEGTSSAAV